MKVPIMETRGGIQNYLEKLNGILQCVANNLKQLRFYMADFIMPQESMQFSLFMSTKGHMQPKQ